MVVFLTLFLFLRGSLESALTTAALTIFLKPPIVFICSEKVSTGTRDHIQDLITICYRTLNPLISFPTRNHLELHSQKKRAGSCFTFVILLHLPEALKKQARFFCLPLFNL